MKDNKQNLERLNKRYRRLLKQVLKPRPKISGSEWANQHCYLPSEYSATPGPYNWRSAPYQREWLDVMCDDETQHIVIMAGVRTGKTQCIKNAIAYFIVNDPSPILYLLNDETRAGEFSQAEFDPMVRVTPSLKNLFGDRRKRDSGNTKLLKTFPGGQIRFRGAATDSGLHGLTIRCLFADETDRYDNVLAEKGNPLQLAIARTISFRHRKKKVFTSTPLVKGRSHIENEYLNSDQRKYFVPCPHCGEHQVLEWKHLMFTENPQNPEYVCQANGCVISHDDKHGMLQRGEWRATNPESPVKGYHINALYSPYITWAELVTDWKNAQGDRGKLQVFINSYLAETWEEAEESITPHALSYRLENYNAPMPTKTETVSGAGVLTFGADVQEDRIELSTWAFGQDDERWLVDVQVFPGEVAVDKTPWAKLTDYVLNASFPNVHGAPIKISAGAIDIAYQTDRVFRWLDEFQAVNVRGVKVFGIMGDTSDNIQHIRLPMHNTFHRRYILLGTKVSKDYFMTALQNEQPGPNYIHLPKSFPAEDGIPRPMDKEVLEQLASEALVTRYVKGQAVRKWEKKGGRKRNEQFDMGRYAYAALMAQGADFNQHMPELVERVAALKGSNVPVQPTSAPEAPLPRPHPVQRPTMAGGVRLIQARRPGRIGW